MWLRKTMLLDDKAVLRRAYRERRTSIGGYSEPDGHKDWSITAKCSKSGRLEGIVVAVGQGGIISRVARRPLL